MSLYTVSNIGQLPSIKEPKGLKIELTKDASLLSTLGNISVEEVWKRLSATHLAFVAFIYNQPAAFGWMAIGKAYIGELNHEFILPEKNRYLWNFRTLAEYRGLGIYPSLLQFMMRYEGDAADRFWIIHAPENKSSFKGIAKAGFEFVGKLYAKSDGRLGLGTAANSNAVRDLLNEMNFNPSAETSASCWNCNSPFLKKRVPSCCCFDAELACTGDPAMWREKKA